MPRRKNHPKKRSPLTSSASATPTESESSTPPSPALVATPAGVTEIPPLLETPTAMPAAPIDLSDAPVAEAPAPGFVRSMLRWVPILGRFV